MLSIIVAVGKDNVIGCDGDMVWNIPEDLKRFKELTTGKKIIMGRKTFQSLPFVLPKRYHIVLTNDVNYYYNHNNVEICRDIDYLINQYKNCDEEIFIIGGEAIYKDFINKVDKLYVTYIDKEFKGDTFFPQVDENLFVPIWQSKVFFSKNENCKFHYVNYIKKI